MRKTKFVLYRLFHSHAVLFDRRERKTVRYELRFSIFVVAPQSHSQRDYNRYEQTKLHNEKYD